MKKKISKTLYDKVLPGKSRDAKEFDLTHFEEIRFLLNKPDLSFDYNELEIFDDLAIHERHLLEYPTSIHGDIQVKIAGELNRKYFKRTRNSNSIGGWVEADGVSFKNCSALGILYIPDHFSFHRFIQSKAASTLKMLLVCGTGLPRPGTRRILHRLSSQFKLPVYCIGDNSTWGYFLFSLLKRGSIAPNIQIPQLAVQNLRYLGLRAGDNPNIHHRITWKSHWSLRMKALSQYSCFKSGKWQREFVAFKTQGGKYELGSMTYHTEQTKKLINEVLVPRLKEKTWLD